MLKKSARVVWTSFVMITIVAAFAVSLVRLLLPLLSEYRSDIELWLETAMGQPVQIGGLNAGWSGFYPRLHLTDVSLLDASDRHPILTFKEVRVAIDWTALVTAGRVEPGSIGLVGIEVLVERRIDGTVRVAGIATGAGPAPPANLRQWFLSRKRLSIEKAVVRWLDTAADRPLQEYRDVDIVLKNEGQRHQLVVEGGLPAAMGRRLRFAADVRGDPFDATGWSGRAYLAATAVRPADWLSLARLQGLQLKSGLADAELWAQWRDGRLVRVDGHLSAADLKVRRDDTAAVLDLAALAGRFQWRREDAGWRLLIDEFTLAHGGHVWPSTQLALRYATGDGGTRLEGAASYALLEDVGAIADRLGLLAAPWRTQWQGLNPRGTLRDAYVRWQRGAEGDRFYARADLRDGAWRPFGKAPAVTGLDATIFAQNDAAFVALSGRDVSVDLPYLFRDPIAVSSLDGWLALQREGEGWRLWSDQLALANRDIKAELSLGLDLPGNGAEPTIDLVGQFRDGRGASKSAYLPVGIMSQPLVRWLDNAIVSARVPSGGVVVRGPVRHFPFVDGEGRFEVSFAVEEGVLEFASGWPRIEAINAEVAFNEANLRIVAPSARTFTTTLQDVVVEIPNMRAPDRVLSVVGRGRGPLDDGLRYLRETPLRTAIGTYFSDATASGRSDLRLDLRMPLHGVDHKVGVKGSLGFANNGLVFQNAGVDIAQIDGTLDFTETGVAAENVNALVVGQPARLSIGGGKGGVTVSADGDTRLEALRQRIALPVLAWLAGETRWHGELRLGQVGGGAAGSELTITSGLEGVAIPLPSPLGKTSAESRALLLTLPLPLAGAEPVRLRYGDALQGALLLGRENGALELRRGELRFNAGPAEVPGAAGLRIAGRLARFDLSEWAALRAPPAAGAAGLGVVTAIDVRVDEMALLGRSFIGLQVVGQPKNGGWEFSLDSERLAGRVRWPQQLATPLAVELERLVLDPLPDPAAPSAEPATDPRELPALRLSCVELTYDQRRLGALDLTVVKIPEGLRLVEGLLRQPSGQVKASGSWTFEQGVHASALDVTISSGDFGQTLASFGYAEAIHKGNATGAALLNWPGTPAQYAPERLSGRVKLKVDGGRILEVNPGAGRIFGLLSLQALPRRLTLDFSDVFAKGFSFDKLDSEFAVTDGKARIERLLVEGPAALVEAKGDVDLGARTYDQTVKVIPNITGSLPLVLAVGAAVGSTNPVTGAAVWLVERLLRKPLNSVTQITYKVTGPWESPHVQPVSRIDAPREAAAESAE